MEQPTPNPNIALSWRQRRVLQTGYHELHESKVCIGPAMTELAQRQRELDFRQQHATIEAMMSPEAILLGRARDCLVRVAMSTLDAELELRFGVPRESAPEVVYPGQIRNNTAAE